MIDAEDVLAAAERLGDHVRRTPLYTSPSLAEATGADVHLKLENLQRTGSFKLRGAINRISALDADERTRGVVTASGGNHAQGVALAAALHDIAATIVMPVGTSRTKVDATRAYGGEVILHGSEYYEAAERAHAIEAESGKTYVHAFEDPRIIAGQGTVGLEILEDKPDVETVVVPIGGGGLIGGIATAIADADRPVRVIGVESAGARSPSRSLAAGTVVELDGVDTFAEGMATRHIGERTLALMRAHVDEIVAVDDVDMAAAMHHLVRHSRTVAEPAGAAAVAALRSDAFDYTEGEVIVPVVSGGNVDADLLARILTEDLDRVIATS